MIAGEIENAGIVYIYYNKINDLKIMQEALYLQG